ncbi:MAG TPA: hypothetical protein VFC00_41105 [Micromonosporaceae bacterium]|nr:hypothetical protein [Micromonosporaceae bacterium]
MIGGVLAIGGIDASAWRSLTRSRLSLISVLIAVAGCVGATHDINTSNDNRPEALDSALLIFVGNELAVSGHAANCKL